MANSCYHPSIEGAQHGAKSLAEFLDYAKRSGATGAQPSNYMLQGGKLFKSAAEIRELFGHVGKSRRVAEKRLDPAELAEAAALNADKFVSTIYGLFVTTGAIDVVHARDLVAPEPTTDSAHFDVGACLRRINIGFAASSDLLTSRVGNANDIVSRNYFDSPRVQIAELTAADDILTVGLDLRRDSARALVTGLRPDLAFKVQVWRGVVDGTLERYLIEGLLRFDALPDDWWEVDSQAGAVIGQRSGRQIRIGDRLDVTIARIHIPSRRMDLALTPTSKLPHRNAARVPLPPHDRKGKKARGRKSHPPAKPARARGRRRR